MSNPETTERPPNRQLSGRLRKRRVIECTKEESERMLNALGKAIASPTRDDGSSKKEFRRG